MRKLPSVGDLRERITFEQAVKADDGHGGHTLNWATLVTVWAQVEPISGREYFEAHQISAEVTHKVRIRYLVTINESMRAVYRGRILEIESIIDMDGRRRFLEIFCREAK